MAASAKKTVNGSKDAGSGAKSASRSEPKVSARDFIEQLQEREAEGREFTPEEVTSALDALAERLEDAERRSTLAITGIDQSVVGLVARLDAAERRSEDAVRRALDAADGLHAVQAGFDERLGRIEAARDTDRTEAKLKNLEDSVSRLTHQVGDLADGEAAHEMIDRAIEAARTHFDRDLSETREGLRRHVEHAIGDVQRDLRGSMQSLANRVQSAEAATNSAIHALQGSVARLEKRAASAGDNSQLMQSVDQRFLRLARELADMISSQRTQVANELQSALLGELEEAGGMQGLLKRVDQRIAESEKRHREALQALEQEVTQLGDGAHASLVGLVSDEITAATADLETRIERTARTAESAKALSEETTRHVEQLTGFADKILDNHDQLKGEIAKQVAETEDRVHARVETTISASGDRLAERAKEAAAAAAASAVEPVQRALTSLGGRLEKLEHAAAHGAPPRPPMAPAGSPFAPPFPGEAGAADGRSAEDQGPFGVAGREPGADAAAPQGAKDDGGAAKSGAQGAAPAASADREAFAKEFSMGAAARVEAVDLLKPLDEEAGAPSPDKSGDQAAPIKPAANPFEARENAVEQTAPAPKKTAGEPFDPFAAAFSDDPKELEKAAFSGTWEGRQRDGGDEGAEGATAAAASQVGSEPIGAAKPPVAERPAQPARPAKPSAPASQPVRPSFDGDDDLSGPVDRRGPQRNKSFLDRAREAASQEVAKPKPAGLLSKLRGKSEGPARMVMIGGALALVSVGAATYLGRSSGDEGGAVQAGTDDPFARDIYASAEPAENGWRQIEDAGDTPTPRATTARLIEDAPQAAPGETLDAAAAKGDPLAVYLTAVEQRAAGRFSQAVEGLSYAANAGLAQAQYDLARAYERGEGVERDLREARSWTQRAAEGGHRGAMHNLAVFFAESAQQSGDYAEAARWFERAARRGMLDSQFNLAILYENGLGVPRSIEDAAFWLGVAGVSGDGQAGAESERLLELLSTGARKSVLDRVAAFRPLPLDPRANGVFIDQPWRPDRTLETAEIRQLQDLLMGAGYDDVELNGQIGPRTEAAIRKLQALAGLKQTGEPSIEVLDAAQTLLARS